MKVSVRQLVKHYDSVQGRVVALDGIDFDIEVGEFYTLLGPSGCGKSTTLRCIAGLEHPNGGEIIIGEKTVAAKGRSLPPNLRPIGMVFQSYAIWPHMTVFNNVAFPLKQVKSRVPNPERTERVMETLRLVKMEALADRPTPFLSGGQQQRVALARALVSRPEVLLLDEPLSNLDAKLREELRMEIKQLTRELGITTLYVTHDQLEALAMSDRIAVMREGRILQEGTPRDIYLRPQTPFVAQFLGQVNFFQGGVAEAPESGMGKVDIGAGSVACALPQGAGIGDRVIVAVRPENMKATRTRSNENGVNVIQGDVEQAVFLGDSIDCQLSVGGQMIRAKVEQSADLGLGETLYLAFRPEACTVFRL